MSEGKKKMSVYALLAALFAGGGYLGVPEAQEALLVLGDQRWVTVASQNQSDIWRFQDELDEINDRIDQGIETGWDIKRKAVLEDRLKRLVETK